MYFFCAFSIDYVRAMSFINVLYQCTLLVYAYNTQSENRAIGKLINVLESFKCPIAVDKRVFLCSGPIGISFLTNTM